MSGAVRASVGHRTFYMYIGRMNFVGSGFFCNFASTKSQSERAPSPRDDLPFLLFG